MSECNYCTYSRMKRKKPTDHKITKLASDYSLGGLEIYVHPKDVKIRDLTEHERKKYWKAWFMALPDHCCC